MFVDPTRGRSLAVGLIATGVFALGACNDPAQNTDLRPEGDPEVLTVLVMNDAVDGIVEEATFCKVNDEKRPERVGLPTGAAPDICPADRSKGVEELTNAAPDGWYVRIMFDELLDPSIEELEEVLDPMTMEGTDTFVGHIANTHPVKLECESIGGGMVEVEYDGYYSPSGNAVTWPLGPSLVIKPNDPTEVATGKKCTVTINDNVTDKSGNKVPAAQRGPYPFHIAPIQVVAIDPPDDPAGTDVVPASLLFTDDGGGVTVTFNTEVDPASVCDEGTAMDECEFLFSPDAGGVVGGSLDEFNVAYGTGDTAKPDTKYTGSIKAGSKFTDRCGVATTFGAPSEDTNTLIHVTTDAFKLATTSPGTGDTVSMLKRPTFIFTNEVDVATFVKDTDYTITPAPETVGLIDGGSAQVISGLYKMNTEYTVTLKTGAVVSDLTGAMYTQAAEKVIKYRTQPMITAAFTPANEGSVTKASATSVVGVTLAFNQAMDPASLDATEYTLTSSQTIPALSVAATGCSATSSSCSFKVGGVLLPGDYTFTLKAGATIDDKLTPKSTYTQTTEKVIKFTVKNAPAAPPPHVCL